MELIFVKDYEAMSEKAFEIIKKEIETKKAEDTKEDNNISIN